VGGADTRTSDTELLRTLEQARWRQDLPPETLTGVADLADRFLARLEQSPGDVDVRGQVWRLLDVVRRRRLLRRVRDSGSVDAWADRILALIDRSGFTFWQLFDQRVRSYGPRVLFRLKRGAEARGITWEGASRQVERLARALVALFDQIGEGRVAILSENRVEMALLDLACLSTGVVNVMLPTNSTAEDVGYMLSHSAARVVFVSSSRQRVKVQKVRDGLPELKAVVVFDEEAAGDDTVHLQRLLVAAGRVPASRLSRRRLVMSPDDLASVMYTSGTTGTPKGICFSQRNIVFKRFARALALPDIGDDDVFICYLPLCHTFGRFLELAGCVFWGATYVFAESTSIEVLADQMRRERASVMISIPLKWIQLYELVRQEVDIEAAPPDLVAAAVRQVTGGRLRWGLSAAGYLDPGIFRFFQRQGVELMSGFGMTEATGGITMTPPGRYRDDSLGPALPGIELSLAGDGELLIRGPYVSIGHLDPPDGEPCFDERGWFHTGDMMEMEPDGFIRIVDRKKDIYKNVKGETIAPQRVENLFRSFATVRSIFLVGDHQPYNTALIFPDHDNEEVPLEGLPEPELNRHFRDLVVMANGFLAPFERIVDFVVLDRDFEAERGERTAKGTLRRRVIERNFADVISRLYQRAWVKVGGVEVLFPNWFFQALGATALGLSVDGDRVTTATTGRSLTIRRVGDGLVQVGSAIYGYPRRVLPLSLLLRAPALRLGNEELIAFAPPATRRQDLRSRPGREVEWLRHVEPTTATEEDRRLARELLYRRPSSLDDLALAARLQGTGDPEDAEMGVRILEEALDLDEPMVANTALHILRRGLRACCPELLRRTFRVLAMAERPERFVQTLSAFLDAPDEVLDEATTSAIARRGLPPERLEDFVTAAERRCASRGDGDPTAEALLRLLAACGAAHPSRYRSLRGFLARMALVPGAPRIRRRALEERRWMEEAFKEWLGQDSRVAVDPETGREYGWVDVLTCGRRCRLEECPDGLDRGTCGQLRRAIENTALVRGSIFLFSGVLISLHDIPQDGIAISHLATRGGKSVYRLTVTARAGGRFHLVVNVNRHLTPTEVQEETDWLVVCGESRRRGPVAEGFGGYWPEHGIWTEEYVPGLTLDKAIDDMAAQEDPDRLIQVWPYVSWTAASAFVDFWDRTWRKSVVLRPGADAVVVPTHDYHVGARLISRSPVGPFEGLGRMLVSLLDWLIRPIEQRHPVLRGVARWRVLCGALLEIVGETEGVELLQQLLEQPDGELPEEARDGIDDYLRKVRHHGFMHRRLYFAINRFHRWLTLNPNATRQARAATLRDLYVNYGLGRLQERYPEARVRLFRETVFFDASEPLQDALGDLSTRLRTGEIEPGETATAIADLCAHLRSSTDEDYFLARLSYPHLQPDDRTGYVPAESGGTRHIEMMVSYEDKVGTPFRVRHALNVREVGGLHRLFLRGRLVVRYRPEHRYLVAIDDLGRMLGGLVYETRPDDLTAHLEKIVVARRCQGKGIGRTLLDELFSRLKSAGYTAITTGFYRPGYFHARGFRAERHHAGLVRPL